MVERKTFGLQIVPQPRKMLYGPRVQTIVAIRDLGIRTRVLNKTNRLPTCLQSILEMARELQTGSTLRKNEPSNPS